MSQKSECNNDKYRTLIACFIVIVISQFFTTQTANAQFSSESYYDPELQDGGIPVLRNQPQYHNVAPGVGWSADVNGGSGIDDDHQDLDDVRRANVPTPSPKALKEVELKRRNSYVEPEDGLDEDDEEDRDEYQSGSRNHDSYTENPAFGESRKAAKDGEDIESFFDKHLGPQDALEGAASNTNNNEQEAAPNEVRVNIDRLAQSATDDPDEMYEAAASGPLASIFHSLLSLHKRPLVITTTDDSPTSGKESGSPESSSASATSSSSTSSPSSIVPNLLSASSALQGSASSIPSGNSDLAPIDYLSPLNTASSIVSYEPIGVQTALTEASGSQEANGLDNGSNNEGGQVREIYIARRPSLFSSHHRHHFQAYTPTTSHEKLQSQMTPMVAVNWGQSSGAYGSVTARPSLYSNSHLSDYSRYPVAASQNYHREPNPQETTNSNDDEEQTVSFGLSFSEHPIDSSSVDDSSSTDGSTDSEEQSSANDDPPAYVPYNTRNLMTRYPPKSSATSTDYNYPAIATSPDYSRVTRGSEYPLMRPFRWFEQQAPFNGARYHRDPTESLAQQQPPTSYNQYSRPRSYSQQSSPQLTGNNRSVTRQQLLANLDGQIKTNRYYQQHQAETKAPIYGIPRSVAMRVQRVRPAQQTSASDYLDTYSSYHSESDPYRLLTTASRIVSEPIVDRTLQSGSNLVQSNVGLDGALRMVGNISISSSDTTRTDRRKPNLSVQLTGDKEATKAPTDKQKNLLSSGITVKSDALAMADQQSQKIPTLSGDLLRKNTMINNIVNSYSKDAAGSARTRVRREDSDVSEDTDTDDDGVWVDDEEDDDSKQQSSNVNETSQDPEEEEDNQQDADTRRAVQPVPYSASDIVGGPHGYDIAPGDMIL